MVRTRSQDSQTEGEQDDTVLQEPNPRAPNPIRPGHIRFAEPLGSTSTPLPRQEPVVEARSTDVDQTLRARPPSPTQSVRSQRSTASTAARRKQAEFEAAERLAALKKRQLEMQMRFEQQQMQMRFEQQQMELEADLVQKKLEIELTTIQAEEQGSTRGPDEPLNTSLRTEAWLRHTDPARGERSSHFSPVRDAGPPCAAATPLRADIKNETRREHHRLEGSRTRSPTPNRSRSRSIEVLAETLERLVHYRPPPRSSTELPTFSGAASEWMPFKASMRDSTRLHKFSPIENLQRLRNALKGEAREAVASLLYAACDPMEIMEALEQSFGRPEALIDKALEEIKQLPALGPTTSELNIFAVKVRNIVSTIHNVEGLDGCLQNRMLTRGIVEKLPPDMRRSFAKYASENRRPGEPHIVILSRYLNNEATIGLEFTYSKPAGPSTSARKELTSKFSSTSGRATRNANVFTASERKHCLCCGEDHEPPQCNKIKEMTVNTRWEWAKSNKICFKCLAKTHRREACKAKSCGIEGCIHSHHQLLHQRNPVNEPSPSPARSEATVASTSMDTNSNVMLKVCPIIISNSDGMEIHTYALLDEGSTITLIEESLADQLNLEGPTHALNIHGVNSTQQEGTSRIVRFKLRGKSSTTSHIIRARTIRGIQLLNQTVPLQLLQYPHLQNLEPSSVCYEEARPRLLIGSDNWELIVSKQLLTGRRHEPAASRTELGWVIHGLAPRNVISYEQNHVLHIRNVKCTDLASDERLDALVRKHFELDAIGISVKTKIRKEDERAMTIFERTARRVDGRFEVGLPWKTEDVTLPCNYAEAFTRLRNIERKMDRDESFKEEYSKQIANLLNKGYAKLCDGSEGIQRRWFLPHFAVRNPNKPGKVRLVFDAAATHQGTSLNTNLLDGPDQLKSLPGILYRFRERAVAVTADIQEMFLRIRIRKEDQQAQMFLWRGDDRRNPPKQYKMVSLIFGARSSPFLAHSVRNANAREYAETHPRALRAITESHYMDDLVDSYNTEDEAIETAKEINFVHEQAGFILRGWNSNSPRVLSTIPEDLRAPAAAHLGIELNSSEKTLGLLWIPNADTLAFNTSMNRVPREVYNQNRAPTKREALSAVMSIFDPLGLLSLFTITAKILLQNLWRLQVGWDEPVPTEIASGFGTWLKNLEEIKRLQLPRFYNTRGVRSVELHILCDASAQAYAAVAYWRILRYNGNVDLVLVSGKAKVAPLRAQSIPRMELQAALIGARLAKTIVEEHRLTVDRVVYWSDSKTALQWIRNGARRYTPFVAHRLGEIAELTQENQWRWIPTNLNIADDATRMNCQPIKQEDRWFIGPLFLLENEDTWPHEDPEQEDSTEELVTHVTIAENTSSSLPDISRFSSYEKLIRSTARILVFVDICRKRSTSIEVRHLKLAEYLWQRTAQEESFADDLSRLRTGKAIQRTSRLIKVDPVLEEGLLRVRGRIDAAIAPDQIKRPIILDGRHPFTKLLLAREHCAAGHANNERVVNDVRQKYWVINLRPAVKKVARECLLCRLRRSTPNVPAIGNLPAARLDPFHRPFTNCGVDFFGPMLVAVGRRREKRWGVLFTCLTTRAVHLELAASLSTDSALMAIRRMAARRGWPTIMYSDNATNFRGADAELKKAYSEWEPALRDLGLLHRMQWRFIPPGAPNQGGAWERLVRSVKVALNTALREKIPREEVLITLLSEAEYSINARPLTHVSVDPADSEALTPNHFLLGTSMGLPFTGPCEVADRRTWRAAQALADTFWRRWVHEYLPTLVPRGQPASTHRSLKKGDLVVIVDPNLPRNFWPRGIIEEIHPGPDGEVRSATVRTSSGVFHRPTRKLAVLTLGEEAARKLR
ncbi:uncharacterized protein LOC112045551 [Bicyclus anynana]|uniref:Uncharacterized protein LOC112045551 n=1 Tax=Bicyclus anynana TaxID=110368 RepID=A0A6J1N3S1_BICAN|nr:uncharacterized protein LOC112045551 [Bicyclus anynana]